MRDLALMMRTLMPEQIHGRAATIDAVRAWLSQDEVQELLAASWDPALAIKHEDHGVSTKSYEDPETGEEVSYRTHEYSVECTVRGRHYGVLLSMGPDLALDGHRWLLAEMALRERLVSSALVGPEIVAGGERS